MMIKAEASYTEAEVEGYEYLGNGKILASLKTGAGDRVWYVMSARKFMQSINAAVALMNDNLSDFLTEIRKPR